MKDKHLIKCLVHIIVNTRVNARVCACDRTVGVVVEKQAAAELRVQFQ